MWCQFTKRHLSLRQRQLTVRITQRATNSLHKCDSTSQPHNATASKISESETLKTRDLKLVGCSPKKLLSNNVSDDTGQQSQENINAFKTSSEWAKSKDDGEDSGTPIKEDLTQDEYREYSSFNLRNEGKDIDIVESPIERLHTLQPHDMENNVPRHAQTNTEQQENDEEQELKKRTKNEANCKTSRSDAEGDHTTKTYDILLRHSTLLEIIKLLKKLRVMGLPDTLHSASMPHNNSTTQSLSKGLLALPDMHLTSRKMKASLRQRQAHPKYRRYLEERMKLPINHPKYTRIIISTIEEVDVLVLVSQTGSGKTTQLPQLLLEYEINTTNGARAHILCTQPRRIAAQSIARRVATEQVTVVGDRVGCQVRFHNQNPTGQGTISYWTAGILLRLLADKEEAVFDKYSTIIVDEVHERDLTTDLCLALLRDMVRQRRFSGKTCPKIILMSATIDEQKFEKYFAEPYEGHKLRVATLHIPGRNYEVETHTLDDLAEQIDQHDSDARAEKLLRGSQLYLELEDAFANSWYARDKISEIGSETENLDINKVRNPPFVADNLIALTIAHIIKSGQPGDILVFLPGMREIENISELLLAQPIYNIDFTEESAIRIFRLHAALSEHNQEVFEPVPKGCRRIILATNIAQTSITLPDVVHVIDSAIHRTMTYDYTTQVEVFRRDWISKATSIQRRGRAGRTRPGQYWMMMTDARYESLAEEPTPDIQMVDLVGAVLLVKAQIGSTSVREFLTRVLDAPELEVVASAIEQLQKLEMLDGKEEITSLGKFASYLPISPAKSRGLLYGVLFRCLRPLLTFVSHDQNKRIIDSSESLRVIMESNMTFAGITDDDRFAIIKAFDEFDQAHARSSEADIKALQERHIQGSAYNTMLSVGRQIYEHLVRYGLAKASDEKDVNVFQRMPPELNQRADSQTLVTALALTMTQPRLAVWNEDFLSWYSINTRCSIAPFGLNSRLALEAAGRKQDRMHGELLSYDTMFHNDKDPRPMLVETSSVTPLMAILFGGPVELIENNVIRVDGWLRLRINTSYKSDSHDYGQQAALLVLELRKALDRFLDSTLSNLVDESQVGKLTGHRSRSQVATMLKFDPLRDTLAEGLAHILETDAKQWWELVCLTPKVRDSRKKKWKE